MRLNSTIRSGIATATTQAPSTNLVKRKITVAVPVTTAPSPLIAARRYQPGARPAPVDHEPGSGRG